MDDAELVKRLGWLPSDLSGHEVWAGDHKLITVQLSGDHRTRILADVKAAASRIESLSAVIARVEALCDEAPEWTTGVFGITKAVSEADLRAALAQTEPQT